MTRRTHTFLALTALAFAVAACGTPDRDSAPPAVSPRASGELIAVVDSTIDAVLDAAGVAGPIAQSTLSTKLMGTVTEVLVREGDVVTAGQPLVRIDARELAARRSQVDAGIAEATAVQADAETQANRMRALYADSAATRAQLDAAETGLARATAAVNQARAGASELAVMTGYSVVRAPFTGVVTQRFVDPGAFAAPGAPLVTVQDSRRLRVTVSVAPEGVRGLRRGSTVTAVIDDRTSPATIEGVVPSPAGNVYTVNAIVDNASGGLLSGSAASLRLPQGSRNALMIPLSAVRREGDLTGVMLRDASGDVLRWVRLGATSGNQVEVLSGLAAGDQVVVPTSGDLPPRTTADSTLRGGGN